MKYESPITCHSIDMANVKVFEKWVKLQGSKNLVPIERSCHKEHAYEIWKPYHLPIQKIWPMLKFLKRWVKLQGHKVKKFGTNRKVLSWGTCIWNMKALSLTIQKIWPMLKFLQTDRQAKNYIPPIFRYRDKIRWNLITAILNFLLFTKLLKPIKKSLLRYSSAAYSRNGVRCWFSKTL
jgi:hypothetical protein